MSSSNPETNGLTDEQCRIVDAPPSERILVLAGAGTGKTHVLAARLAKLVTVDKLQPGSEILVLSFSRAAVAEIHRRLTSVGDKTAYVAAMTFDSFATHLLAAIDPNGDWQNRNYDGRIAAAVKRLDADLPARQEIRRYRHLLIDEIQDLVGVRAAFVMSLLEKCECGFTLMGDPAQSIYEFQADLASGDELAAELFTAVRDAFSGSLTEQRLTTNFRAKSPAAMEAAELGDQLRTPRPDYAATRREIDSFMLAQQFVGDLRVIMPLFSKGDSGETALLCRTNGEALLVSRRLSELGVAHRLQREAVDRIAPPWVAPLLEGWRSPRISKSRFLDRCKLLQNSPGLVPDSIWRLLKRLDTRRVDDLDLRLVAQRICTGAIPEELNFVPDSTVVVSTIHRAKGLEFERVILTEPKPADPEERDEGAETRLVFVAITRARQEIFIMKPPDIRGLWKCPASAMRWVRRAYGAGRQRISAIEVRGADSDTNDQPYGIQDYIRSEIKIGDPILLDLRRFSEDGRARIGYEIRHRDQTVGAMSPDFVDDLAKALGGGETSRWPDSISELFVECIDSAVGKQRQGSNDGPGIAGIFSRVRVFGLGEFRCSSA